MAGFAWFAADGGTDNCAERPVDSNSLAEPVDICDCESVSEEEGECYWGVAKVTPETHETSEASKAAAADGALQIDADPCPICLDTVTNGFRTPCGHIFCSACLAHALFRNDSCPVCRSRGVHTCATPKDDCPLCVAGHKPGVVVPNVYVREERARRRLADSLTRLQRCLSIGAFVLLVYMGARGMFTMDLHFAVAGLACALLMLANMVGHIVGAYARLSLLITRRRSPQAQPAVEEAV